jgi:class 3 adenylate cyclase
MEVYNRSLPSALKEPLGFGIGIATGKVFAGNIGSPARMKYVVMGDPVNLAARLQALTKKLGQNALVDGETANQLNGAADLTRVGKSLVRGKLQPVEIFAPGDNPG